MHLPDGHSMPHSLEAVFLTVGAVIAVVLLAPFSAMHADEASQKKSINGAETSARVAARVRELAGCALRRGQTRL